MHYGEVMSVYPNVSFLKLLDRCEIQSYHSNVDKGSSLEVWHGLLGLLEPKGEESYSIPNVWNYSPSDTSYPRRLESSAWQIPAIFGIGCTY